MGTWTTRARGAFLDSVEVSADKLKDFDFVLAKAATGEYHNELFAGKHVQAAYDANISCTAWLEVDPNIYAGLNPNAWAAAKDDWHCRALDRALYVGGVYGNAMRAVKGIIIDISNVKLPDGSYLTATWLASIAQHMVDMVYERYKQPVYLYLSKATYNYYKSIDVNGIGIEAINQVITRNGICFPGVSVVLSNGYPSDAMSPWSSAPFAGTGVAWYFWGIGMVNGLYSFLYNGDKASLYKELGFTPHEEASDPEDEPEEEDPEETDPEEENNSGGSIIDSEQLETLIDIAEEILQELRNLNNHLGVT